MTSAVVASVRDKLAIPAMVMLPFTNRSWPPILCVRFELFAIAVKSAKGIAVNASTNNVTLRALFLIGETAVLLTRYNAETNMLVVNEKNEPVPERYEITKTKVKTQTRKIILVTHASSPICRRISLKRSFLSRSILARVIKLLVVPKICDKTFGVLEGFCHHGA